MEPHPSLSFAERDTPFGRLVVVGFDEAAPLTDLLPDGERLHAATLGARRRAPFAGGRVALRRALAALGDDAAAAILPSARGAPRVPPGTTGSISHKDDVAVALATRAAPFDHVGVDVEHDTPLRVDISGRILRPEELLTLADLDAAARDRRVRVTFAVKEAIYKAIDPVVARYVGFREVALHFGDAGAVTAALHLERAAPPLEVEVAWEPLLGPRGQALLLAFARARRL